jgi:hypothetical protein
VDQDLQTAAKAVLQLMYEEVVPQGLAAVELAKVDIRMSMQPALPLEASHLTISLHNAHNMKAAWLCLLRVMSSHFHADVPHSRHVADGHLCLSVPHCTESGRAKLS